MTEGHSFACEAKLLSEGCHETRSHAVGQYLDKRALSQAGPGRPVGHLRAASATGLTRGTSINRASAMGRELQPLPTPAFSVETVSFCRCHSALSAESPEPG